MVKILAWPMRGLTERWIHAIRNRKTLSFWIALIVMIFGAACMRPSSLCLISPVTPLGIVDLELAFDQPTAQSILRSWSQQDCHSMLALSPKVIDAAILNILLDFIFILGYGSFLFVLLALTHRYNRSSGTHTVLLCNITMLAGILDIVENTFMLLFLHAYPIASYTFAIPASVKFGLILVVVVTILIRAAQMLVSRGN